MARNSWNESEASQCATLLDQRVYSSRLLGGDPSLVMHGGGNTSVKGSFIDVFGKAQPAIFIKGSGWDLATIEARGFPAVRMEPLQALLDLPTLDDVSMMNELRRQLANPESPDPSVETLLHALIPHRFVDHTHADAILTVTNQPDGENKIRELFGKRVGIVPYVMPGFMLAKACAEVYSSSPTVEALILLKHGIFTFADSAKAAYEKMIQLVTEAEDFLTKSAKKVLTSTVPSQKPSTVGDWAVAIRREMLKRKFGSVVSWVEDPVGAEFAHQPNCAELCRRGPLTPDHVIRTKRLPLYLSGTPDEVCSALDRYEQEYREYFLRNSERKAEKLKMLDPLPRIAVVDKLGAFTIGATHRDASINADIFKHTAHCILRAESVSSYEALPESDIFDVEYWILEQRKLLLGPKTRPLSGKSAVVTGGAQGIGLAIAKELSAQGAVVHVWDLNERALSELNGFHTSFVDVTNRDRVAEASRIAVGRSGGIDILVVNAGIFPPSNPIEKIDLTDWQRSLDVNLSGAFHCVSEVLGWMKRQAAGGDIVFISSKNVPAPGKEAAAYSVAKAGQAQLARVCALEAGSHGIRVNTLHPHLIFDTGLWGGGTLEKRAEAYGMSKEQYMTNNLLKTSLNSEDVARATFCLVSGGFSKTTGAQIPVDGGSDRTL